MNRLSYAQVFSTEVYPGTTINFPAMPELLDTLGNTSYSLSNHDGYYACLVMKNAVPADKLASLDLNKFYMTVYETLQAPEQGCQLFNQSNIRAGDINAAEFWSRCKPDPDFPEIRYKRLLLAGSTLYVLDHWTFTKIQSGGEERKNSFFNSFKIKSPEKAVIPSAFENSNGTDKTKSRKYWAYIAVALGVLAFVLRSLFRKQKPPLKK